MSHMVRTFIAGLIVVLPIVLTIALVVWIGNLVYEFVGPNSIVGRLLSAIGFGITASSAAAYAIGIAIVVARAATTSPACVRSGASSAATEAPPFWLCCRRRIR